MAFQRLSLDDNVRFGAVHLPITDLDTQIITRLNKLLVSLTDTSHMALFTPGLAPRIKNLYVHIYI